MSTFMDPKVMAKNKIRTGRKKVTAPIKRTLFSSGRLYIVDDEGTDPHADLTDIHPQKCNKIRETIAKHTPYPVTSVPVCEDQGTFLEYWRDTLRAKSDDEITIIYFHGNAGGNGHKYRISLENSNIVINGYKFFEILCKSEKQILVILDCYLPERFKDLPGLQRRPTCEAAFEVVACGAPGQDTEGRMQTNPFTSCIVKHFSQLVALANNKKLKRTACFSLLDLLASNDHINKKLHDNPKRLKPKTMRSEFKTVNKEKVEVEKVVPRLYFDPAMIRKHKKVILHCDIVKDTKKEAAKARKAEEQATGACAKPADKPASIVGDEGYDDDMSVDESPK